MEQKQLLEEIIEDLAKLNELHHPPMPRVQWLLDRLLTKYQQKIKELPVEYEN